MFYCVTVSELVLIHSALENSFDSNSSRSIVFTLMLYAFRQFTGQKMFVARVAAKFIYDV